MMKIAHLTSAHSRYDSRIFFKMCLSLSNYKNCDVFLVVADGKGNECKNKIEIFDVGEKQGGRISRMTKTVGKIFEKAKKINANIYHLHDPELLTIGLKLKKGGKKVIFDAHEDYISLISLKEWIPPIIRTIVSYIFEKYYNYSTQKMDGVVVATNDIKVQNKKKILYRNLPNLRIKNNNQINRNLNNNIILYTGGLTQYRGITEVICSLQQSKIKNWQLVILGQNEEKLELQLKKELKDPRIIIKGEVPFKEVVYWLQKANIGVVMNQPIFPFIKALPNKLFEYMAFGLPVVCSNFPQWKEIVEVNKSGICCNPLNLKEISKSVEKILVNQDLQKSMSINGQKTIRNNYNLENETKKLIGLYKEVLHEKKTDTCASSAYR